MQQKGKSWEAEYLDMKHKYLQTQKTLNRLAEETKLRRVQDAKQKAVSPKQRSEAKQNAASSSKNQSTSPLKHSASPKANQSPKIVKEAADALGSSPTEHNESLVEQMQPNQSLFAAFARAGVAPPDPTMVWGVDQSLLTAMKSNALIQINEQLRNKLIECDSALRALQSDVARYRRANDKIASDLHGLVIERDHLLLERENFSSRLSAAESATSMAREQMRDATTKNENIRHTLEQQSRELRTKLAASYDANESLASENRRLSLELRETSAARERLVSRLAELESSDGAQREVNGAMLLEMRNLNDQLATERRRVLDLGREVHLASERQRRIDELEILLKEVRAEKYKVEQQNLQMLEDATQQQQAAFAIAKEALRQELETAQANSVHWENVCRLQFRDIQIRTKQHLQTQEELMAVKAARDEAQVELIQLHGEVDALRAKLDVVWPSHLEKDISPSSRRRMFQAATPEHSAAAGLPLLSADAIEAELQQTDVTPEILISELRQANTQLLSELETAKMTLDVLAQQQATTMTERNRLSEKTERLAQRENKRLDIVAKYANRIDFLEAQVRQLRGHSVDNTSFSTVQLEPEETVMELQLGQLVIDCKDHSAGFWSNFPMIFVTADFLLHETVSSDVIATSTTAFFGVTAAYRVKQDALLVHYLTQRALVVEIHNMTSADKYVTVGKGSIILADLVKEPTLLSRRPSCTFLVDIFAVRDSSELLARVEVSVTSRLPFSANFVELCLNAAIDRPDLDSTSFSSQHPRSGLFLDRSSPAVQKSIDQQHTAAAVLNDVKYLSIRFLDITIEQHMSPQCPLLTLWYAVPCDESPRDTWVLPPSPAPQYVYRYNALHRHHITTAENALLAVRNPIPIVLFEESQQNPEIYWGVASMNFIVLADDPNATVSLSLPVIHPIKGDRLATLRIEAAFEFE